MKTALRSVLAASFAIVFWSGCANAITLIADDEAQRPPPPPPDIHVRGISRGPSVVYQQPGLSVVEHTPFEFKVKLEAHGGSAISPDKVHVTYLKGEGIDLTSRLRPFITPTGIDMPAAEVPAGDHQLRVDVEDSDGRSSQAVITLAVVKHAP